MTTFHILHLGDLYEVSLRGHIIARISCYIGGQHRQDMQYDDLPPEVQDKILDKVQEVLNAN